MDNTLMKAQNQIWIMTEEEKQKVLNELQKSLYGDINKLFGSWGIMKKIHVYDETLMGRCIDCNEQLLHYDGYGNNAYSVVMPLYPSDDTTYSKFVETLSFK